MKKDVLLATLTGNPVVIIPMLLQLPSHLTNRTGSLLYLLGSKSGTDSRARKVMERPQLSNKSWLRVQSSINDNYCVKCVTRLKDFVDVSSKVESVNTPPVLAGKKGVASKRETGNSTQRRLHSPLLVLAKFVQVTNYHMLLCKSSQEPLLVRGIASASEQKCSGTGSNSDFYNRLFLVPKPNSRWRPILDLYTLNTFLNTESFKMRPETIRTSLQAGDWVISIDFKDNYFIYQFTVSPGSTCIFTSRASPASSKHYPLASPQHPWSSQWWQKR